MNLQICLISYVNSNLYKLIKPRRYTNTNNVLMQSKYNMVKNNTTLL